MSLAPPRASTAEVTESMLQRAADRLGPRSDAQLRELLADCVYQERKRFAATQRPLPAPDLAEQASVERAARALRGRRADVEDALFKLVRRYTREVHNEFSDRTYRFTTRLMPGMLTRLLTAAGPREKGRWKRGAAWERVDQSICGSPPLQIKMAPKCIR